MPRLVCRCASTLAVILLPLLGCNDEAASPTGPEAPLPAINSTQTLALHQVSSGGGHTCGVTTDHRAYCWGSNGDGALGDGTTTNRLRPVAVKGGHRFRSVAAGSFHTCGVSYPDNRAYCWGYNDLGQLGTGTTTTRLTPLAVAGGRAFRQVSSGFRHTCGVTTSGEAFCWGWNRSGQLGGSSEVELRLTPSRVAGARRYREVDAGGAFTCAVNTNDRAFCWGAGTVGQIGDGKPYLRFWPRAVAGGLSFGRVTAGGNYACGETTNNRAYCWGWNRDGEVGDGTQTMRLRPVPVAGGLSFSQVSAGEYHTCGVTAGGRGYCRVRRSPVGSVSSSTT